ncbi:metallophosphoesterase [Neolewinella aurantiaca]|uniref:Metallophosphoesterase n=1 Tax=Neolewinella aurantiaca TaxID=2602767 RepID=A0A5C7FTF6_9BACT|nr:metallophosphoesterase [Neolewinella aurantiaca]TXF89767.1 metallophosphoesterase [Neolewinella aurantiaca]
MQKLLLILSLLLPIMCSAQSDIRYADGPYLIYDTLGQLQAYWAWPEDKKSGSAYWSEDISESLPAFRSFRPETIAASGHFDRDRQVSFDGVDKVAVVSDIHGQFDVIRKVLISHGIIDDDLHWAYGDGHFVIVGDVFDRGGQVTEVLWLLHNLQIEAKAAGGRVHFLLGNHETMVMDRDVRYVNKRYMITSGLLRAPYYELFGLDSYLGRWLRSLPLTIRINDMVFVHGGFSKDLLREVSDLGKINDLYHMNLIDAEPGLTLSKTERLGILKGRNGPLWYRGYFLDRDFEEKDIDRILKRVKANRMVVGHTSFQAIRSFFGGKVLAVDSSMKFGSMGEVLLIEEGKFIRGGMLGERMDLFAEGK